MRKFVWLLLLVMVIFPVGASLSEVNDGSSLSAGLTEVAPLNPKYYTNWLNDRDALLVNTYTGSYQLITPEGETLFTAECAGMSYLKYGYFEVYSERGLNQSGLMNSEGQLVIPYAYSDFDVLSDRYCIAVVLEETEDDAYDYASGILGTGNDHYNVTSYDFYDLSTSAKIGSLERSDYKNRIKVYHDGFLIESRSGTAKWYNLSLEYVKDAEKDYYNYKEYDDTNDGIVKTGLESNDVFLEGYSYNNEIGGNSHSIRSKTDGRYGAMDADGNIIVPCEFTEIVKREGEYVIVGLGEYGSRKYGIYHIGEGLTVPCEFDKFEYVSYTNYIVNGYVMFSSDEKLGYINLQGEPTCPALYKSSIAETMGSCYFVTDLDGSYIIVAADNTQSKVDYAEIYNYDNNTLGRLLNAKNSDEKWGLINCYGEPVTEFSWDYRVGSFSPSGNYVMIDDIVYKVE